MKVAPSPSSALEMHPPRALMLGKGWFPAELGGLDRYFRELIEAMPEARGVVVGPGPDAPARVKTTASHNAPLLWRLLRVAASARSERSIDLVDVHFAIYGLLPILLSPLRQKPLVVHFHGPWADESLAAGDHAGWRIRLKRAVEGAVYRRAALLITLTEAFKEVLVQTYGVAPEQVVVVAPGVDSRRFTPEGRNETRKALGIPTETFLVCCARRLVPRMGIDVLLAAWELSLAAEPNARLLVAGAGVLEPTLRAEVKARGWEGQVSILGRLSDSELIDLYRAADVNVVPSRGFEGFGLIVLEAAACGTPSIVTDSGGLPEAVRGLSGDLTVPVDSPAGLADRLVRARLGGLPSRSATRTWAATHSWETTASRHRQLYETLLSSVRPLGSAQNLPTSRHAISSTRTRP